jgi:outer membrane receptor protein involved in Fe transport
MAVGGSFPAFWGDLSNRYTIQADLSHYAEDFLGEHDLKFGVQYTRGRKNSTSGDFFSKNLTNLDTGEDLGPFGYYQNAYLYSWDYSVDYMKYEFTPDGLILSKFTNYSMPTKSVRTADSLGFFFDDQWTPTSRLTLNLGIRYDLMTAKFAPGQMYEQPTSPDGYAGTLTVTRERKGSDNLFDFKCLSPRLGVTYQLTKDQKTALRASWGRYYSPMGVESFGTGGPDPDKSYGIDEYYLMPWEGLDINGDGVIFDEDTVLAIRRLMEGEGTHINAFIGDWDLRDLFHIYDPAAWELRVAPGLKNQHTDQWTVSLERELFRNFSVALTYINRNTKNMIVMWPINPETGKDYEWERKTQVINGQEMLLYSIVLKDYNGDGQITNGPDGDIQWLADHDVWHHGMEWRNLPNMEGKKAQRVFQGLQLTFNKRYSDRWQLMGSLLWNSSNGVAARNKRQDQDYNLEAPFVWQDPWLGSPNQLLNNMEGPLPFTPRFEFKLNGNYTIPKIEVDFGFRYRMHNGRPSWVFEPIPLTVGTSSDLTDKAFMEQAVILTGGDQVVAQNPKDPLYYPVLNILDLRLEKAFGIGPGRLHVILDCFNVFNSQDVTNAYVKNIEGETKTVGQISGIVAPRKFRFGIMYDF